MRYVRLGVVRYVAIADAPTLGATYSGAEAGRMHPQESVPSLRSIPVRYKE